MNTTDLVVYTLFSAKSTFTKSEFKNIAKLVIPQRYEGCPDALAKKGEIYNTLSLVHAQTKINRRLRKLGLCLKSKDYYSTFYVVEGREAINEVHRYNRTARTMERCANTLGEGIYRRQEVLDLSSGS